MDTKSITTRLVPGALILLGAACASGPSVRPQLAESAGAVRAADETGANEVPAAALHLKYARSALERGRQLVEEGEEEMARRALEQAELDAELALALVKEHKAESELARVDRELEQMNTKMSTQ